MHTRPVCLVPSSKIESVTAAKDIVEMLIFRKYTIPCLIIINIWNAETLDIPEALFDPRQKHVLVDLTNDTLISRIPLEDAAAFFHSLFNMLFYFLRGTQSELRNFSINSSISNDDQCSNGHVRSSKVDDGFYLRRWPVVKNGGFVLKYRSSCKIEILRWTTKNVPKSWDWTNGRRTDGAAASSVFLRVVQQIIWLCFENK